MNLPNNYLWIPGFEQRYAMKITDSGVEARVYSLVYPGHQGIPSALTSNWTSDGNTVALSPERGYTYKDTYRISALQKRVSDSKEYKALQKSKKATSNDFGCCGGCHSDSAVQKAGEAGWIIGSKGNSGLSFSTNPKIHPTERSAFAECERLAKLKPGTAYVVLKTVRQVVAGGLNITTM